MREFKYQRSKAYSLIIRLSEDGTLTFRNIVVPHEVYSAEYNAVVDKMMTHAETALMKLLKEETNVTKLG